MYEVLMFAIAITLLAIGSPDEPPIEESPTIPSGILQVGGTTEITPSASAKKEALKTDPVEAEALTKVLQDLLKKNLPDPVTKSNHNWGHQKAVTTNVLHRDGLKFWTEQMQEMKNDGTWRRADVRIPDQDKIAVAVTELTHPEEGKMLVTVSSLAERVDLHFEQQIWKNGVRLYGGETRGHCRGALVLKAEITTKTEIKKGLFFPSISLNLKVTSAELFYEKLVIDHTAGLNGEAAKAIGDVAIGIVKAIKPNLEKDLLEKADTAIVKAAQKKELTLTLDKLLATKKKEPEKK
jgi:hypothetical protein